MNVIVRTRLGEMGSRMAGRYGRERRWGHCMEAKLAQRK